MDYKIVRNDITNMKVNAIVLPANTLWMEGPGTSAAIFEKAGRSQLKAACKQLGKAEVGEAKFTLGFDLPCDYIIHAVVPKWKGGKHHEYAELSEAYLSSMLLADALGCRSIAFPLLSSGNNGFDLETAFEIAVTSIGQYQVINSLQTVFLVLYSRESIDLMRKMQIPVEESIDEKYVLENIENSQAQKLAHDGFEFALQKVNEFWADPKNKEMVYGAALKVADWVLAKNGSPFALKLKGMLPNIAGLFGIKDK